MFKRYEFDKFFPGVSLYNIAIGSDGLRSNDVIDKLSEIRNEKMNMINNGTYRPVPYKEKLILKGRGKISRLISIPSITDRFILSGLNKQIQLLLKEKQKMPQQLVGELSKSINKYKNYLRLDLTTFYDNMDRELLCGILTRKKIDERFLRLIKVIIEQKTLPASDSNLKGIPQGLPISNSLAQIYLEDLRQDISEYVRGDFKIIRYVDDIIILFNDRAYRRVFQKIISLLRTKYSVEVNKEKTNYGRLKSSKLDFLGYRFEIDEKGNPKVTVKDRSISQICKKIVNTIIKFKKSRSSFDEYKDKLIFQLRIRISGLVINNDRQIKKYGWIFFYSQITDLSILFRLDKFLKKQLCKNFKNSQVTYIYSKLTGFVRSYFEMKKDKAYSRYAVHPDEYDDIEKKEFLSEIANVNIDNLDEKSLNSKFKSEMFKCVKTLEEDISIHIS